MTGMQNRKFSVPFLRLAILSCAVFIVFASYWNSFDGSFQFDDYSNIVEAPGVWVQNLSFSELKDAALSGGGNRPLSRLTLGLNYYLGQRNPFGYHVFNLAVHIATFLFLFLFLRSLFKLPALKDRFHKVPFWLPLFGALIWALHPIQVQAVTYVVQRMASMAGLFVVLSLFLYVKGRLSTDNKYIKTFFAASFVSFLLAVASKENAAVLPVLILLLEFVLIQKGDFGFFRNKYLLWALGVALVLGLGFIYVLDPERLIRPFTLLVQNEVIPGSSKGFTPLQRELTQFRVLFLYLLHFFLPLKSFFSIEHYPELSVSVFDPITTLPAVFGVVLLLFIALTARKRWPLLSFALFWYFLAHSIEAGVPGLDLMYDHRMYIPSMLIPVTVLYYLFSLEYRMLPQLSGNFRFVGVTLSVLAVIFLGIQTNGYNKLWSSEIRIWEHTVDSYPNKVRPLYNLAEACKRKGKNDKSRDLFKSCLQMDPDFWRAYWGLGYLAIQKNDYREAKSFLRKALAYEPKEDGSELQSEFVNIKALMSTVQANLGFERKALSLAESIDPEKSPRISTYSFLGLTMLQLQNFDRASEYFQTGLQRHPYHKKFEYYLALAHGLAGNDYLRVNSLQKAIESYNMALEYKPNYTPVLSGLMKSYWKLGKPDKAVQYGEKSLSGDSVDNSTIEDFVAICRTAGNNFRKQGNTKKAISFYQKALEFDPDNPKLLNNLAWWMATSENPQTRNVNRALELAKRAVKVTKGKNPVYLDTLAETLEQKDKYQQALDTAQRAKDIGENMDGFNVGVIQKRISRLREILTE